MFYGMRAVVTLLFTKYTLKQGRVRTSRYGNTRVNI